MLAETRAHNPARGPYPEPERQLLYQLEHLGMAQAVHDMLQRAHDPVRTSTDADALLSSYFLGLAKNDEAFAAMERVLAVPGAVTKVRHLSTRVIQFINVDPTRALKLIEAQRAAQPEAYYLHVLGVEAAAAANQVGEAERIGRIMVEHWADRTPPGFPAGHPQIMLADVLEHRGEPQEAARLREQARRINPEAWTPAPGPRR
jgi:tetratricopeptide (TPR) repeat protein